MMMKSIFAIILISLSVACSKYNDSELRRRINATESRIDALEQKLSDYNESLKQLTKLVEAQQAGDLITSVDSLSDNRGWKIVFASGKEISIYNGKNGSNGNDGRDGSNGQNGADAVAPIISVKQDSSGTWCWTINGEWLVADGEKVPAVGKDGATPEFYAENGYMYVRYDAQSPWNAIGEISTMESSVNDFSSVFSGVSRVDDIVVFTLSDGTTLSFQTQTANARCISFEDPYIKAICIRNFDTNHDGELSYEEAAAVTSLGGVFSNLSWINMHYANDYWNAGIIQLGNPSLLSFDELKYFTSLENISSEEFSFDINLWRITFPASLTTIGTNKTVTFTASDPVAGGRQYGTYTLTYGPFTNCPLASVTFLSEVPIGTKPFFDLAPNGRIYVPESALITYQSVWSSIANQIEAI